MANIVSPVASNFSDARVRPSADLMVQAYYLCLQASDRWVTLGSNQAALDQMQSDIRTAADRAIAAFDHAYWTEKAWFSPAGIAALFPNDASPLFDNGSNSAADTARPAITGANVNNVVTRCVEFQNWLLSVAGSFAPPPQVETATAAGTVTLSGNATVTVTALGMAGSPKAISVAVTNADTAATWAGKVRTALAADASVNTFFTVSGAGTAVVLTALAAAANDATMNVALANGTSTGITAAPTSANTTAGVAPRGGTAWLGTAIQVSSVNKAAGLIVLSDAQNFLTRCGELKTNYQASSNANLTTLLTASVNPTYLGPKS